MPEIDETDRLPQYNTPQKSVPVVPETDSLLQYNTRQKSVGSDTSYGDNMVRY